MALLVHGAHATSGGRLDLWVDDAAALFARLRAGESYTVAQDWDGSTFVLADPAGFVLAVHDGPGGSAETVELRLDTDPADFEERAEWWARLGFAFEDERDGAGGEERLQTTGPVRIWICERTG